MLHLSANIKLIRVLAGKTQDEFADLLGYPATKDMIYTYEKGMVKKPNEVILQRIADIGSTTLDQLLNKPLTEQDVEVLDPESNQMQYRLRVSTDQGKEVETLKQVIEEKQKTIEQKDGIIDDLRLIVETLKTLLPTGGK